MAARSGTSSSAKTTRRQAKTSNVRFPPIADITSAKRGRLIFLAALVTRRKSSGLHRFGRWQSATLHPLDGDRRCGANYRTAAKPRSPRLVARRPPDRVHDVRARRGAKLGSAPDKPEGAKWADPLQVINAVTYRTDEEGYLDPGYSQLFSVPAEGGSPVQLTFGATNTGGDISWTPDGRSILFSADLSKNWEREALNREIYRISIDGGVPVALTSRVVPAVSQE
jgi:hypothetical protein